MALNFSALESIRGWQRKRSTASSQKASRMAPIIMSSNRGRPVWTPRRYDALAEEGYHKNVIVYRCVNVIARAIASVPWLISEKRDDGDMHELYDHPILNLLNQPSAVQAGSAFIESVVSYLLLAGNSYIEAVCNDLGLPIELYVLRPDRMA
ncbi:MAG: phage portal protein, partial [Alphaproteobacteria bacterium]|nr:phage portal protein [Alphaproteobacteria bacterium]MBX9977312.1 phage portal protein [Alphaproteobacteria bacterium]